MFLYLACPASISFFFLAICRVGHPLTIIIWFNKVVVVVVKNKTKKKPSWYMSHYTMIYENGERMRDFFGLFVFIVV